MKNATTFLIPLALPLALQPSANAMFEYTGSDTLAPLIEELLRDPACGTICYLREGSLAGQKAIGTSNQQTSPMSKSFSDDFCANNPDAYQAVLAIDKVLVTRNNQGTDDSCDTDFVRDVPGYESFTAPQWAEVLQLIYGGRDGAGTPEACQDMMRLDLINNWGNLWENDCNSGKCEKLRYAFRRGDRSGTSFVIRKLAGIEKFCNGEQHQDLDPIRTDCSNFFVDGDVDYCPDGDLGVVQAIDIPKKVAKLVPLPCVEGNWDFGFSSSAGTCPDGTGEWGGFLCLYPRDCNDQFGCVNNAFNASPFNPFMDGRDYNYLHLNSSLLSFDLPADTDDQGKVTRYSHRSLYFNHRCGRPANPTTTQNIGCLVHQVGCSIGFGGLPILDAQKMHEEQVEHCGETVPAENVATRFDGIGHKSDDYRLSRNLYLNANGLSIVNGKFKCKDINNPDERMLCECLMNEDKLATAATTAGLIPLPSGPQIVQCGG